MILIVLLTKVSVVYLQNILTVEESLYDTDGNEAMTSALMNCNEGRTKRNKILSVIFFLCRFNFLQL